MPDTSAASFLMLRPWQGCQSGGNAFAHFDALPMTARLGPSTGTYGDYQIADEYPLNPRAPLLHNFRFKCQADETHAESYAWQWGYRPSMSDIFTPTDMHRTALSFTKIEQCLKRMHQTDGPAETIGRFVVRLARALKLDGIAILETSPNGSFREHMRVDRTLAADYGLAMQRIDQLAASLHRECARRVGKAA